LIGVTAVIASMATVVPVSASTPLAPSPPKAATATTQVRADFDGDGRSDTAVTINPFNGPNAPEYTPGVRVWLSADPSHPTDFLFGAGGLPRANGLIWPFAAGNFNGDGYADLAMIAGDGTGVVLYGSPTGLGAPQPFNEPTDDGGGGIKSGAAADVNGDGYDDLIVTSDDPDGALAVLDGSAAGLPRSASQRLLAVPTTALVGVGDLNGDGYDDVAVTGGLDCATINQEECSAAIVTLYGSASGLGQPAASAVGFGLGSPLVSVTIGAVGSVQVADFNQDGYDDIAVGTNAGEVAIFRGGPAGLAPKPSTFLAASGSPDAVGDVNGDGFPDLALSGGVGGVPHSARATVLLGSPAGLRTAGAVVIKASQLDVPGGSTSALQVVGLLDVTGDGKADLVADATGNRMFYLPAATTGFSLRGLSPYSAHGFGAIAVGRLMPKSHPAAVVSPTAVQPQPATATAAGQSPRRVTGDVNGDGFPDLVIGDPGADAGSISTAGQVVVVPGSADGFRYARAQTISAASPGVPGDAVSGEEFGASVAVGDFNGDGYADVAIDVLNAPAAGQQTYFGTTENVLDIVYGGLSGLRGDGPTPATSIVDGAINNTPAPSLAAGDFDGNGYDDLAVADDRYRHQAKDFVCSKGDALGRILIFSGSRGGLVAVPDVHTGGCSLGVGSSLLATDLDHDGRTDLVATGFKVTIAGQFNEDDGGDLEPGASRVETMFGGPNGLSAIRPRHAQAIAEITLLAAPLAAGDVNGDGHTDIVVGIPNSNAGHAGVIDVLLGHGRRLGHAHRISQPTAGIPKRSRVGSEFGSTLAVGRVNAGRFADIVVGVPLASAAGKRSAGQVLVLYSGRHGFRHHATVVDQSSHGIGGAASTGNEFGFSVALRRGAGHTTARLIIGVPGANHDSGGVATLRTTQRGLTTRGAEWTREQGVGLPGEAFDFFGYAVG
jgi:hypothetical protein